jgi:hypothetical protein
MVCCRSCTLTHWSPAGLCVLHAHHRSMCMPPPAGCVHAWCTGRGDACCTARLHDACGNTCLHAIAGHRARGMSVRPVRPRPEGCAEHPLARLLAACAWPPTEATQAGPDRGPWRCRGSWSLT